jgi:hypothetical protein
MRAAFGGYLGPEMKSRADTWAHETPNIKALPKHVGHRAFGGPIRPGGNYMVGERGPEMVHMGQQGGMVQPMKAGMPTGAMIRQHLMRLMSGRR